MRFHTPPGLRAWRVLALKCVCFGRCSAACSSSFVEVAPLVRPEPLRQVGPLANPEPSRHVAPLVHPERLRQVGPFAHLELSSSLSSGVSASGTGWRLRSGCTAGGKVGPAGSARIRVTSSMDVDQVQQLVVGLVSGSR